MMSIKSRKMIDTRASVKKINKMINMIQIIERMIATRSDLKIISSSDVYLTIRFSKTVVRQKFKGVEFQNAVLEMINEFMTDVYLQVCNNPLIENFIHNNIEGGFDEVLLHSDLLFDIIYTNINSNTLIIKIK